MPRPTAIDAARQFRQQLAGQEAAAVERMGLIYARIYRDMVSQTERLAEDIAAMDEPSRGKIAKLARLQQLLRQVEDQAARFGQTVQGEITVVQNQAIQQGVSDALKLMELSLPDLPPELRRVITGSFTRLPVDAIEAAAGLLGADSPLTERLTGAFGQAVAQQVEQHIVDGIAAGMNPRRIAGLLQRNLQNSLGTGLTWTLTTVRTAQIKSYQLANHATYQANPRIVPEWTWVAALDSRTCLSKNTLIACFGGDKRIQNINKGDLVITHAGRYRTVTETMRRAYVGEMVKINTRRGSMECTTDHPILVRRGGKNQWMIAGDCQPGDIVFVASDDSFYNIDHSLGNITIKRSVWDSDNFISLASQSVDFSGVGLGALGMPVNPVNFNGKVEIGQEKINGVTINTGLLFEFYFKLLQALSKIPFRFGFFSGFAVTSNRAVNFIVGRNSSKYLATFRAGLHNWRAAAFLRAVMSYRVRPNVKFLATTFTFLVALLWRSLRAAPYTANCIPIGIGPGNSKDFTTGWASFSNISIFLLTGFATKPLRAARWMVPNFTTVKASKLNAQGFLESVVAINATESPAPFTNPGSRDTELFPTDVAHSFCHTHIISISRRDVQCEVYNLEVDDDHTYVANGIVVHNCLSCIAQHGSIHPITETLNDHHNGRCAPVPKTISYRDLGITGIPDPVAPFESGEDWFGKQPEATQRQAMGPAMFKAYKDNRFSFRDLSRPYQDEVYGELLREASLRDLLGEQAKEYYRQ